MAQSRERLLADYCLKLSNWAVGEIIRLWRNMDRDDIRLSWSRIRGQVLQIHQAQVVQALKAVDDYMFTRAADAGFAYGADWTRDYAGRPETVNWGESARKAFDRAPVIVLARIGKGEDVTAAMMAGLNYLIGIVATEAHQIERTVLLERMLAQ